MMHEAATAGQAACGESGEEAARVPLGEQVQAWTIARLRGHGFSRPVCKRLALVVTGLLYAPTARRGDVVQSLAGLRLSTATPASIDRRVDRTLEDPRLDPHRILPCLFADLLPTLLADEVRAHAHAEAAGEPAHAQFPPLRVIVDGTSKGDQVHILTAGLGYQGTVLPLGIRVWQQNSPMAAGEWWRQLGSLLLDVQRLLPGSLRDHVVLLADRGFGVPRMIDLAQSLGWSWLLRVTSAVRLLRPDGTSVAAASLAPTPGTVGSRALITDDLRSPTLDPAVALPLDLALEAPIAAFKKAGWRRCSLVAAGPPDADAPWLLLTNLSPDHDRLLAYAQRWQIERLFLSWKSHGWDLESLVTSAPRRLGRLLSAFVASTLWTLACAVAHTTTLLASHHAATAPALPQRVALVQLRLPFLDLPAPDHRPWPAKFSLFTWGRQLFAHTPARYESPPLCWAFPDWHAPTWSVHCQQHWFPT